MNKVVILMFIFLVTSCDPMDDKLVVLNTSKHKVLVRTCFLDGDTIYDTWGGVRLIESETERVVAIMGNWESEFRASGIEELSFLVHNAAALNLAMGLDDDYQSISDSLVARGEYVVQSYTYDDLEQIEWKVVYPESHKNNSD